MQESYSNKNPNHSKHEIFSKLQIPPTTPFFARLDGRRFKAVSGKIGAEKPFDKRFTKCLVRSARAVYRGGFNPALIYVASDELNVLFLHTAPFRRRVEKINSTLAGIASSAFSLGIPKNFGKNVITAFDSRIIVSSSEKIMKYLGWRQRDAWRNHNNAYAYWLFRKMGHAPSKAAKMLKGLKSKDLHEILFRHGINLAKTPQWQRRGILVYREPYQKQIGNRAVTRRRIEENWELPLFSSEKGQTLIQKILEWAKPEKGR
ncbi:MAG: tRNA(His) guanylyltransferase Thg1 family protein [Candidatus Bathyarchaeia archaeon]